MNDRQKLVRYYVVILAPFAVVLWALFTNSDLFLLLFMTYIGFRVWFDRRKLIRKGVIDPGYGHFRFLIHGHVDYFRQLYLEP